MLNWINENLKAVVKNQNFLCLQVMEIEKEIMEIKKNSDT